MSGLSTDVHSLLEQHDTILDWLSTVLFLCACKTVYRRATYIVALAYSFVAGRVDMMTSEQKVIQLIHLFRGKLHQLPITLSIILTFADNLFFNKDPPRYVT